MVKRTSNPRLPRTVSPVTRQLLDRFPITHRDDTSHYHALFSAVFEALDPQDMIEEILARDVADLTWEVQWLRNIEASFLTAPPDPFDFMFSSYDLRTQRDEATLEDNSAPKHAGQSYPETIGPQKARDEQHFKGDNKDHSRDHPKPLGGPVPATGLRAPRPSPWQQSIPSSNTRRSATDAFERNSHQIEQVSRLISSAEARRNQALTEFERYRTTRQSRPRPEEIVDAEFTEAPPQKRQARP